MDELYNEIIDYMDSDIGNIFDKLNDINVEITRLQDFYNSMMEHNSDYDYDLEIFKEIYDEKMFEKFKEGIYILDRVDVNKLTREPQVIEILSLIDQVKEKLLILINNKINEYETLKKEYSDKRGSYHTIIDILNNMISDTDAKEHLKNVKIDDKLNELVNNYLLNRKIIHAKEERKANVVFPKLDSKIVDRIKEYLRRFYNLSITEKNSIISANELILQNDYDNLSNVVYGFNIDEILYYTTIYNLIDEFNEYMDLQDEKNINDAKNDEELEKALNIYLDENIRKINNLLKKLSNIEEKMIEKEESEDVNSDNHNIVIFLDVEENDKFGNKETISVVNSDIQYIKNVFGGEADGDIKKIIRMLNTRFIGMNSNEFRKLGRDANKPIVNHSSKIFDEFNIWCSKGMVNNASRIPYFIVSVSDNNKKELISKYHLNDDACVYLVLGLFAKKNDDSEYVRITGNRLNREYDKVAFIQKLFSQDFDELSRKRAFKLIDKSQDILDSLNEVYQEEKVK